jgi:hypothetical protein
LFKEKKVEKVIEVEALGCIPASTSDCVDASFKFKTL